MNRSRVCGLNIGVTILFLISFISFVMAGPAFARISLSDLQNQINDLQDQIDNLMKIVKKIHGQKRVTYKIEPEQQTQPVRKKQNETDSK